MSRLADDVVWSVEIDACLVLLAGLAVSSEQLWWQSCGGVAC